MMHPLQNMAVLFADISDSTRLYATLGDNTARVITNACLSLIETIVQRYKGRVIKTIGDAVLCIFSHADEGVLAASEMQAQVATTRPGNYPVKIHIGLHYGPVIAEDDDIFGDTVNAAAYLTAVAPAEQILTTEATQRQLSPPLRAVVRPIFKAVLKGNTEESTVYQVLWNADSADLTDVNLGTLKTIPRDEGGMLVTHGKLTILLHHGRPIVRLGRGPQCDVVVHGNDASRVHASIRLVRTHYYLADHSINGTYVARGNGEEVHLLRRELLLDDTGQISLGRSTRGNDAEIITFKKDRRSMYRLQ